MQDQYMQGQYYTRLCIICGDDIPEGRAQLKYHTCLPCGEVEARMVKHCIVPIAKSNYVVIMDKSLLAGLNKYANQK